MIPMNRNTPTDSRCVAAPLFGFAICITLLCGCSADSRDRLWRTLDPAGYKHAHSEVFNPRRYQKEDRAPDRELDMDEISRDLMR